MMKQNICNLWFENDIKKTRYYREYKLKSINKNRNIIFALVVYLKNCFWYKNKYKSFLKFKPSSFVALFPGFDFVSYRQQII